MAEEVKDFFLGMPWPLYVILLLCFGLLVASFIIPPVGVITSSSLQGAAMILGFTWLFYVTANIPNFIERGAKISAKWKDAEITIGRKRNEIQLPEEQLQEENEEDDEHYGTDSN